MRAKTNHNIGRDIEHKINLLLLKEDNYVLLYDNTRA